MEELGGGGVYNKAIKTHDMVASYPGLPTQLF